MPVHPDVVPILEELDAHRVRFETLCRSLTADQLDRPVPESTWRVRDFITHLCTLDGPIGGLFRDVIEGRAVGVRTPDGAPWDVDAWNEVQVQERRARPVEELLAEGAALRAPLRREMERMDERALATRIQFQGDAKRPPAEVELRRWMRGWCKHDPIHTADMLRALPEHATPEVLAWIDDPVVGGYQRIMNAGGRESGAGGRG